MASSILRLLFFIVFIGAMHHTAIAEIWGYVDDKGVGHFSATKLDERYALFSKETTVRPEPVDGQFRDFDKPSPNGASNSNPNDIYLNGISASNLPPKLAKFFESSPALKAVRPHMQTAAQKHNLDIELLQALIATESGFNVTAISPKGALGLMQLIPETASRYGVQGDRYHSQQQKLFDPHTNISAGSHYLRDLLTLFKGQLDLALAAYNAGAGAVQRAGNQIPNIPETQNYVRTVMQMYAALKPPPPPAPQVTPAVASQPQWLAGPDPLRPTRDRTNGILLK
ncbi:MAG: lytic transglycosylase domain-containing protein [Cytophagales bacterium]|nr:lytic transglycosylase domain-containing protein [Cytophagales bacterium]